MIYSLHTETLLQHIHFAPVAISKTIYKHHLSSSLCHAHPVRAALKGAAPFYNTPFNFPDALKSTNPWLLVTPVAQELDAVSIIPERY